jgi:hypothetical protein
MQLFKFPKAAVERLISQKVMSLSIEDRAWFLTRWNQKPYRASFIEDKAQVLLTLIVKSKAFTDEEFEEAMQDWNPVMQPVEKLMLRPFLQGGSGVSLQWLIQKGLPENRLKVIVEKLS